MRKFVSWILVLTAGIASAAAQQAPLKQFDVASVKATGPIDPQKIASGQQRMGMKADAGRVDIEGLSISDLLFLAFKVRPNQVSGPDWLSVGNTLTAERFEIHAKLPSGTSKDDVPEMLQSLLAERFKLAFHREQKEQSVFALIVGKGGSKLQPSVPDAPPSADAPPVGGSARPDAVQISGSPQGGVTVKGAGTSGTTKITMGPDGMMHMESEKYSMEQLAASVTQFVGRPVVDMTGLTGTYRIALELTREDLMAAARAVGANIPGGAGAPGGGPADPAGTSVFQSIEKLGLKLESRKAPIEFLVIDRLEKTPTED